jgi:hypothetical protein
LNFSEKGKFGELFASKAYTEVTNGDDKAGDTDDNSSNNRAG